jgi:rubrerythrin
MLNKFPTISAFVMKADIAKKILYKNDFTLFHLEQYYKSKNYDESYYQSVREIQMENMIPLYFLENYNKGNYIDALEFWKFDFEPTIKCTCGFKGNEIDLITNDDSCPNCNEKDFFIIN